MNFFINGDVATSTIHSGQSTTLKSMMEQVSHEKAVTFSSVLSKSLLTPLNGTVQPEIENLKISQSSTNQLTFNNLLHQMDDILSMQLEMLNELQLESDSKIPDGYYELLEEVIVMTNSLPSLSQSPRLDAQNVVETFIGLTERMLDYANANLKVDEVKIDSLHFKPLNQQSNLKEIVNRIETKSFPLHIKAQHEEVNLTNSQTANNQQTFEYKLHQMHETINMQIKMLDEIKEVTSDLSFSLHSEVSLDGYYKLLHEVMNSFPDIVDPSQVEVAKIMGFFTQISERVQEFMKTHIDEMEVSAAPSPMLGMEQKNLKDFNNIIEAKLLSMRVTPQLEYENLNISKIATPTATPALNSPLVQADKVLESFTLLLERVLVATDSYIEAKEGKVELNQVKLEEQGHLHELIKMMEIKLLSIREMLQGETGNSETPLTSHDQQIFEPILKQMKETFSLQVEMKNEMQKMESDLKVPDEFYELLEEVSTVINSFPTMNQTSHGELEKLQESFKRLSEKVLVFMKTYVDAKEVKEAPALATAKERTNLKELINMIEARLVKLPTVDRQRRLSPTVSIDTTLKRAVDIPVPESVFQNGPLSMNMLQLPKQSTIKWVIDTTTDNVAREQLLQKLEGILSKTQTGYVKGNQAITIRLAPEHLGTLHIRLQETQDGIVAKLVVHSKAAATLLESGLTNLKQTLAQSNIITEKLEVVFQDQEQKPTQQQKGTHEDSSQPRYFFKKGSEDKDDSQSFEDALLEELEMKKVEGEQE